MNPSGLCSWVLEFTWPTCTVSRSQVCHRAPADVDGQPWCNSHYSRQLWVWATVMALSHQRWDASWDGQGGHVNGARWGGVGASANYPPQDDTGRASAGEWRVRRVKGSLTLVYFSDYTAQRMPVFVKDAILHWEPDSRGGKISVAAGTLRVQRIRVEQLVPAGHTDGHIPDGDPRLIAECVGQWEIPAGRGLALEDCKLEHLGPFASVQ